MRKLQIKFTFSLLVSACFLLISINSGAQSQVASDYPIRSLKPTRPVVCYHSGISAPSFIGIAEDVQRKLLAGARTKSANIEVTYVGFSPEAQIAFQRAVDIWEGILQSPVTVNVYAVWSTQLASNVLGSAIYGNAYANFQGAPKLNIFYPVALAEKLARVPLNGDPDPVTGDNYDVYAFFNANLGQWSFQENSAPNQYHLTTVVLHELCHGLGFADSFELENGLGDYGVQSTTVPIIFDLGVENVSNTRLLNVANSSTAMAGFLTSNNINHNPGLSLVSGVGTRAKLFAPAGWQPGSSIAHLDVSSIDPNLLMRPSLNRDQINLDPGPVVKNMFADMGWVAPYIRHTALRDTETAGSPITVTANIASDGTPGSSLTATKLRYRVNSGPEIEVDMTLTAGDTYAAQMPAPTVIPSQYSYYIVVRDSYSGQSREFTNPGKLIRPGQPDIQVVNQFFVGPDTRGPFFQHTPIPFVNVSGGSLVIEADVADNIGVASVSLQYQVTQGVNLGSLQTLAMNLVAGTDSTYRATIPVTGLTNGDKIEYRVRATDQAGSPNTRAIPSLSSFYNVNVVSLAPTQASYQNDFNNLAAAASDFFGNPEFGVRAITGFSNGAIHTDHPYPEGDAFPGDEFNWVYQLRVPIRLKAADATMKFDEVVLVEPGAAGSTFPSQDFFDYVIAEGSKDGGVNWVPLAAGYDSRDFGLWLTRYNSSISGNNSNAVGDATLFRTRTIDLLNAFDAGDVIVVRFRLYSDQLAAGWGWAIDNLKIQIDETPPRLLHDHHNYLQPQATTFTLPFVIRATDASGIKELKIEYGVNGGTTSQDVFDVDPPATEYTFNLQFVGGLASGSEIRYRITATDSANNITRLPASDFLRVPVFDFAAPVEQYIADFNSANSDFAGNFYSVTQPAGFSNGAIHSVHPYPLGFGISSTSNFIYTLKRKVTVSSSNPFIVFDEIGIIETIGVTPKDFAIVEASKDNGQTWLPLVTGYAAATHSVWKQALDNNTTPSSSLYRSRLIKITDNPAFAAGDAIIIRFRLFSDAAVNAWGWAIDNLSVQGPITGLPESVLADQLLVYPNPVSDGGVSVDFSLPDLTSVQVQIVNAQGLAVLSEDLRDLNGSFKRTYPTHGWSAGMYLVRLQTDRGQVVRKLVKIR
jgi:hypothetical protein